MGEHDRTERNRKHRPGEAQRWACRIVVPALVLVLSLVGSAAAAQNFAKPGAEATAAKKKKKKRAKPAPGPAGPQGPAGAPGATGPQGDPGASGSPDTGAQILAKLAPVAGAGSGLDSDFLDGLSSAAFILSGQAAGGDLAGSTYPNPAVAPGAITIPKLSFDPATQAELNAVATGPAGGALSGSYPNPSLNVTGGTATATSCVNGQEVSAISTLAAITCSAGVYSDGDENVAAGPTAFPAVTGGFENSALGAGALDSTTTGTFNSAVGMNALTANAGGNNNSALGHQALFANTSGSRNIAIGKDAGAALTTGSNNIVIDSSGVAGESNTIRIGRGVQTRAFIDGIIGSTVGAGGVPVVVDAFGQLGTVSSSRRYKTEIEPLAGQGDELMDLEPVSFRYKENSDELHYGLIAEQVEKVLPTLVVYGRDGLPETVQYQELPALLLAELQEQRKRADTQSERIERLEAQVAKLVAGDG